MLAVAKATVSLVVSFLFVDFEVLNHLVIAVIAILPHHMIGDRLLPYLVLRPLDT